MAGLKAERIFDSDTGKEVTDTTGKFCIAAFGTKYGQTWV